MKNIFMKAKRQECNQITFNQGFCVFRENDDYELR